MGLSRAWVTFLVAFALPGVLILAGAGDASSRAIDLTLDLVAVVAGVGAAIAVGWKGGEDEGRFERPKRIFAGAVSFSLSLVLLTGLANVGLDGAPRAVVRVRVEDRLDLSVTSAGPGFVVTLEGKSVLVYEEHTSGCSAGAEMELSIGRGALGQRWVDHGRCAP